MLNVVEIAGGLFKGFICLIEYMYINIDIGHENICKAVNN